MAVLKIATFLGLIIISSGASLSPSDKDAAGESDQLVSGTTVEKSVAPQVSVTNTAKSDLKTSDSFGFGYYLPIVAPALVKYHYPLLYYPTYLHSIRHHGYGGYGFYHHGQSVQGKYFPLNSPALNYLQH